MTLIHRLKIETRRFLITTFLLIPFLALKEIKPVAKLFLWILRQFKFLYIFVIYPGNRKDYLGYYYKFLDHFMPPILPAGWITGKKKGFIVASPTTVFEFANLKRLNEVTSAVENLRKAIGAKYVAYAGRFPSIMHQAGLKISSVVLGQFGVNFVIEESLKLICCKENMTKPVVGIIGLGFTGLNVAKNLSAKYKVIGYDVRKVTNESTYENLTLSLNAKKLSECDVVILLTTGGNDVNDLIENFKQGVLVIDDNHPLSPSLVRKLKKEKGAKVYRAVVGANGVKFFPRLPNYSPEWIPGCVIEAIISNDSNFKNQEEFNQAALEAGFHALKAIHRGTKI